MRHRPTRELAIGVTIPTALCVPRVWAGLPEPRLGYAQFISSQCGDILLIAPFLRFTVKAPKGDVSLPLLQVRLYRSIQSEAERNGHYGCGNPGIECVVVSGFGIELPWRVRNVYCETDTAVDASDAGTFKRDGLRKHEPAGIAGIAPPGIDGLADGIGWHDVVLVN